MHHIFSEATPLTASVDNIHSGQTADIVAVHSMEAGVGITFKMLIHEFFESCKDDGSLGIELYDANTATAVPVDIFVHRTDVASESKITQRYDAVNDKIISENDSPEGFYTRTFKRVKK